MRISAHADSVREALRRPLLLSICLASLLCDPIARAEDDAGNRSRGNEGEIGIHSHITANDLMRQVVNHPAFRGFGRYLLPSDNGSRSDNTPVSLVGSLMPYHGHVDVDTVVSGINRLIDEVNDGKSIFYRIYTEQETQKDPAKRATGLFFFRGKPGAPFAVVCPGGGFAYVGSLHEGFPHAVELSNKGYNAFVLTYRVGSEASATEDLAAAISFIVENAGPLEVGIENYSLWGSSAGGRMVGNIALNGPAYYAGDFPSRPKTVVIAYTGHTSFSADYPAVFMTVSEDDRIVNVPVVDRRVENLRNAGVDVEYRKFRNAGHGFGLGRGTDADGWVSDAIRFWERHQR